MKRIISLIIVFLLFPCFVFAEDDQYAAIHEVFANHSNDDLLNLRKLIDFELECRGYKEEQKQEYDETTTRNLIRDHFEEKGCRIKYTLFQPLVEKDEGIYGGKERWRITLESGEQIMAWFKDGKITYCYGGQEFDEIPLD